MSTYRWEGDNSKKLELIPYDVSVFCTEIKGDLRVMPNDGLVLYQLVGEVRAHQGEDG